MPYLDAYVSDVDGALWLENHDQENDRVKATPERIAEIKAAVPEVIIRHAPDGSPSWVNLWLANGTAVNMRYQDYQVLVAQP